jgi:hypothetical protein
VKINQDIKDAIKASVGIMAVVVLITAAVEIYNLVNNTETEETYGFITLALVLHADLDVSEVEDDILNLIDNIAITQVEDFQEIHSTIVRESRLIRYYKESFYLLVCPTDEMRALKESLIEEANLFLISYSNLGEALESKINDDYDTYLLNIEKVAQYLDDAINLRIQNRAELEQWKAKIEAELSN